MNALKSPRLSASICFEESLGTRLSECSVDIFFLTLEQNSVSLTAVWQCDWFFIMLEVVSKMLAGTRHINSYSCTIWLFAHSLPLSSFPAESLKSTANLTVLSLSCCSIDNQGMCYLSVALKYSVKLKDLELNGNQFGPVGSQELAKLIKDSTSIENVFVLGCDAIQAEGTTSLLQAMSKNQSVQRMFLPDILEHAATSVFSHLASRVVWLPDICTQTIVDLSGKAFTNCIGMFLVVALGRQLITKFC